jgi:hypothetical protein
MRTQAAKFADNVSSHVKQADRAVLYCCVQIPVQLPEHSRFCIFVAFPLAAAWTWHGEC